MAPDGYGAEVDTGQGCPHRIDTATFLLHGLDPAEGEEFARHLAGCSGCRAEIEELAPAARLLAGARRNPVRPWQA